MKKDERIIPTIAMPVRGLEGNLMTPEDVLEDRILEIKTERVKTNKAFEEFARHYFPRGD